MRWGIRSRSRSSLPDVAPSAKLGLRSPRCPSSWWVGTLIIFMLLSGSFLCANDDLIVLYQDRMNADLNHDQQKLLLIDTKLAEYYLSVSDYQKARLFLENTISNSVDPVLTDRKMDIYRLDIIEGDLDRAESGLLNVYFYSKNVEQKARASHLLGILNALKGEYQRSRQHLTESLKLRGVWTNEFESTLDSLLLDSKKLKNENTAKWLSTFLPGAGQIYAKNAKGAIGAIGIAAFWGGWFVYDLIQQDYYSAALVLLWPWQRYHRGNIQNAEYSVIDHNARIEDGINRALLEYLSTK